MRDGDELVSLLVERADFFEALADGPHDKRTLADELDTSRSTVDRVLRTFVNTGIVHRRDSGYELTLPGRCALDAFDRYERTIEGLSDAQELLSMLPSDAPIDPVFLVGADVYTSTPDIPDGVIQQLFASVSDSEYFAGVAPVALVGQLRGFTDAANRGGTAVEMVIEDDLFEKLLDVPDSREVIVGQLRRESANLYRTDIPFGFGLWITDDEAGIVVYTDTGVGGLALNDDPDAVAWATTLFESVREDAELVTLASIGERPDDADE